MRYFKNTAISILKGDITQIECDVMVNSCNQSLKKGCGICKAIYTKAGIGLENECEEIRSNIGRDLEAGEFVVSQGYNLPCQYVIHAFAPKCTFGFFEEQESIFRLLLKRIFEQVDKFKMQSIALPAIGTGIHKCSVEKTSQIFFETILEYISDNNTDIKHIYLVLYSDDNFKIYKKSARDYLK